ncbi:MAG: MFS transporter, partial [Mycobacteriales bacterium]
ILGLASNLPGALFHGLTAQGVSARVAIRASHLPPVGSLFSAFLGYNPVAQLLGPTAHALPHHTYVYLTGRSFFPRLISGPFSKGLGEAFDFALVACLTGAVASLLRGGKYFHGQEEPAPADEPAMAVSTGLTEALVE